MDATKNFETVEILLSHEINANITEYEGLTLTFAKLSF